jgi:hypothetical protein
MSLLSKYLSQLGYMLWVDLSWLMGHTNVAVVVVIVVEHK